MSLCSPTAARAQDARSLWVHNVHLNEEIRVQPFGLHGVPRVIEWLRVDQLFRSWRTQQKRPIHPRLLLVLAQIQGHFGGRCIELVSGYRVPTRRDRLSSYHQVARAADIRILGVTNRALFDYCRTLENLGCGLYPQGAHVHIDVRSRPGVWVDLSKYAEPADYVSDARGWVRVHPEAGR